MLVMYDGPYHGSERVASYLQCFDKALCKVNLVACVKQSLTHLSAHGIGISIILAHHIDEGGRDGKVGSVAVVEGEAHGAVVVSVDIHIRGYLLYGIVRV